MIEVRELTKSFGRNTAVESLSFDACPGSVTGFLGPNGAGKSTTLRCLLGLAAPSAGTALIDGRPYRDLAAPRQRVGALVEGTGAHPARSGRNHLRVIARAAALPTERIDPLLALVGLTTAADRRVGTYSLGMRQRLAIATLLLGDPAIIVLDEPTNGLDPEGVAWIRDITRRWADQGRTVLVSSHLLAEVAQVADRVVIIDKGHLVAAGDLSTLARQRAVIRVSDPAAMSASLEAAGHHARALPDGAIAVDDADPSSLIALATGAGVTITHLATQTPGEALEALFLAKTGTLS